MNDNVSNKSANATGSSIAIVSNLLLNIKYAPMIKQ